MTPRGSKATHPFLTDKRLLASKARWEADEVYRDDLATLMTLTRQALAPYTEPTPAEVAAYEAATERRSLHLSTFELSARESKTYRNREIVGDPRARAASFGQGHEAHYRDLLAIQEACDQLIQGQEAAKAVAQEPVLLRFALWLKAALDEKRSQLASRPALWTLAMAISWPARMFAKAAEFAVLPILVLALGATRPLLHALQLLERAAVEANQQGRAGLLTRAFLSFARLGHVGVDELGTGVRPVFWDDITPGHGGDLAAGRARAFFGTPRRCLLTFLRHPLACHELTIWEKGHSEVAPWFANPRSGRYFWAASLLVVVYLVVFVALLPLTWPVVVARAIGKPLVAKAA